LNYRRHNDILDELKIKPVIIIFRIIKGNGKNTQTEYRKYHKINFTLTAKGQR